MITCNKIFLIAGLALGLTSTTAHAMYNEAQLSQQLFPAIRSNNVPLIINLLDNGADVNSINAMGESPLWVALDKLYPQEINRDVITVLLKNGADSNKKDYFGNTILTSAVLLNYPSRLIKLFLSFGHADINMQDDDGETPLIKAVYLNKHDLVRFFMKRGANPKIQNNDGSNAFDLADDETMKSILQKGLKK